MCKIHVKGHVMLRAKKLTAHALRITLPIGRGSKTTTYLESVTPIWYIHCDTFIGLPLTLTPGCLLLRPLMLNVKSSENPDPKVPTQKCQIWAVFGVCVSEFRKSFDFYCKRHIYA